MGRYTLLRKLAQGGMAEVYLARTADASGPPVAVKKILPQFSNNKRFIDMLKDEAKITVSLTHPNIAQVYELGLAGQDYFIVMEYVQGRPLNKLMLRVDEQGLSAIPVAHAVHIMAEVAKGLDHAHRQTDGNGQNRNIVHRDISPQNVLLTYAGGVKVIDFGIARAEGRVNQTNQGVIKGKLRYLAPEIAAGREPDHRADLFCCGIVLFEMLTGEAMFAPQSDVEAIELATQARVKSPRSRNPRVPQALDQIVMSALRRAREDRISSAQQLYVELTRFLRTYEPNYTEATLADFMRTMFRPEIVRERSMNDAAAALVDESASEVVDDPTIATDPPVHADYQQLVTRVEIASDDATIAGPSRLMVEGVELVGAAVTPVGSTPSGSTPSGSTPPDSSAALGNRDKTADGAEGAVPPAAPAFVQFGTATSADRSLESRLPSLMSIADNLDAVAEATGVFSVVPNGRATASSRWLGWLIVAVGVVAVAVVAHSLSRNRSSSPPRGADESSSTARAGSAATAPQRPATLTLRVRPEVPLTVRVDDVVRATQVVAPVVLSNLSPHDDHRVVIEATGYRSRALSRKLRPGERRTVEVDLLPATGTIRLVDAQGLIRASAGRVDDDRIIDIPLNTRVALAVDRPGAGPFRKEVDVVDDQEMRIVVPAAAPIARPRPRGTLHITARPNSFVVVEGKRRGRTPLSLSLQAGEYRVTLESPTGQTETVTHTVRAGRTTTLAYRWSR